MVRRFADVPDGLTFRSLLHGGGWFEKLGGKAVDPRGFVHWFPPFELCRFKNPKGRR
jgi:predicted methyltransferase